MRFEQRFGIIGSARKQWPAASMTFDEQRAWYEGAALHRDASVGTLSPLRVDAALGSTLYPPSFGRTRQDAPADRSFRADRLLLRSPNAILSSSSSAADLAAAAASMTSNHHLSRPLTTPLAPRGHTSAGTRPSAARLEGLVNPPTVNSHHHNNILTTSTSMAAMATHVGGNGAAMTAIGAGAPRPGFGQISRGPPRAARAATPTTLEPWRANVRSVFPRNTGSGYREWKAELNANRSAARWAERLALREAGK